MGLFDNAKFGDYFTTRSGDIAIFAQKYDTGELNNRLLVNITAANQACILGYDENGKIWKDSESPNDIVSRGYNGCGNTEDLVVRKTNQTETISEIEQSLF